MASELGRTLLESRSKDSTSSPEELLVFGYSCKLFRDNEKAEYLDKGKHLIPWMGDNKLMVDRFDVRGALYDLKEAEAGGGADRWVGLTEEEKAEEEKCDYERYLALYHDEFQVQANQEEETKRLLAELGTDNYAYAQVGFSYDAEHSEVAQQNVVVEEPVVSETPQEKETPAEEPEVEEPTGYFPEKDEDTFVPLPELNVPQGMVVPDTVKQNKIILKTSKFIAAQGGQMEILIKTKQAGNPMFSFLAFDHPLNAFYKHTVSMIKSGRYRPAEETETEKTRRDSEGSEGQYLHPILTAGIKPDLTPGTPTSLHKPSADCTYSKLINKIKENQKKNTAAAAEGIESPGSPSVPPITSTPVSVATTTVPAIAITPVTAGSSPVTETNSENIGGVSLKKKKKKNEGSGGSPEFKEFKGLVDYPSFNRTAENNSDDEKKDDESNEWSDEPALCLDDPLGDPLGPDKSSEYSNIKWPPPDVQMVIDKMASYIIKNGEDFESMVRSRDDARFSFLKTDHEYFPYYRCKMRLYNEVYGDIFKETFEEKSSSSSNDLGNSKSTKTGDGGGGAGATPAGNAAKKDKRTSGSKQPSTISFSIKSREQEVNLDRHSTFPVESSSTDDEDMDEEERERRRIEREERRRKRKLKEKEERERREREEKEKREKLESEKMMEKAEESSEASDDNEDVYDIFKYAQEMGGEDDDDPNHNEKYSNGELKKRQNSHGGQSQDNCISGQPERKQQERRKKAAMFLSRLKKGREDEASQPVYGPQLPPEIAAQLQNSPSQSPGTSSRSSDHSTSGSGSRSSSPRSGIPMPPLDSPARPPPPPPVHSPSPVTMSNYENEWGSNSEVPTIVGDYGEEYTILKRESSILSGASEDDRRRSQSVEIRTIKSRHAESSHREKARSRKKHRHDRSESRSPSNRRDRKKRKRSRSHSHRHKKRRSRSRSHSKSHSKSSHKKKRRKHSSRHERSERRSKKSRRSVSSSSSDTSELTYSSRSSSPSESEVQVIESPSHSKRGSRASSIVSVYASDLSVLSSGLPRILEESISAPGTPPLPPVPPSPISSRLASVTQEKLPSDRESATELGNGGTETELEFEVKEEKKEEKKLFDPHNSAAMAKIAKGLRAKVHALLEKESKL